MRNDIHLTDTGFYISPSLSATLQPVPRVLDNSGAEQLVSIGERYFSPDITKMYKDISANPKLRHNFKFNENLRHLLLHTELKELMLLQQLSLYDKDAVKHRFIRSNFMYAANGGRRTNMLTWRNYLAAELYHQKQIMVGCKNTKSYLDAVDYFKGTKPILPMNYVQGIATPLDIFHAYVRHEGGCKELITVLFCMVGQRDGAGESYDKTIQYTL